MVVRRILSDELYHHGEEGQKWGVRHGPPYPLDPSPSKQAARKKKSLLTIIKNKRKGKKLRKARMEKRKEREENEKAIKSGDSEKVLKRQEKMSEEELRTALTRIDLNERIKSYKSEKTARHMQTGKNFLDTTAKTMMTVASAAQAAASVRNSLEKMGILKEIKKPKSTEEIWKDLADNTKNQKNWLENSHEIEQWNKAKKSGDYSFLDKKKKSSGISDEDLKKKLEEFGVL